MNLGWCEHVTAAGVAALAAGCPGLRALDLCGCIWVGVPCAGRKPGSSQKVSAWIWLQCG